MNNVWCLVRRVQQSTIWTACSTAMAAAAMGYAPTAYAQTTLPSNPGINFQTSGSSRCASVGDWYTTLNPAGCPVNGGTPSGSTVRRHEFFINITATDIAATGGAGVVISVLDAESNGALDEIGGNAPGAGGANPDPTRFQLIDPNGTVLSSQTTASGAANGTTLTFPAITTPGVYTVTSETGAGPISNDFTAALNDDDNSFSISVPITGLLIGQVRGTFQNNVVATTTIPFFFLVGPGSTSLFLRNFDLDNDGTVQYIRPSGAATGGTVSGNAVWNGGGDLDNGGDTLGGLNAIADAGLWGLTLAGFGGTFTNQSLFEVNLGTAPGNIVPLFDQTPTRAGNFIITPDTTRTTTIGTAVDHPFTVTNNFFTSDIINLQLGGTDPNYTVQLLTAAGTPLTDTDGDGLLDTGILASEQAVNLILRVTPNAGATTPDTTTITGTSFMDRQVAPATFATRAQSVLKTTNLNLNGSIGDQVFRDDNNNGVQDAGEPGLANVTVTLTDSAGATQTVVTDVNGNYQFTNVPPGNFTATITPPAGFTATTPATITGTLNPAQTLDTVDFGLRQTPGAIGDRVFRDDNNNGVQDAGEPGLGGVTITLTDSTGATRTAVTDANGDYQFTNVPPGNFSATVTPTGGFSATTPATINGTLNPGQTITNVDFGLRQTPGNVGDTVFNDLDGDGVQDPGEPGLANVTVTLTGTDANGAPVNLTLTTDANGNYQFTNVIPGTYTVTIAPLTGFTATTPNPQNITLAPGQTLTNVDFGLRQVPGTIGDRVFNDLNGDGQQTGAETGIAGVTLTLTGTDNAGNPVNQTTTTDANGRYQFTGVAPGTYTVTATPPAGFTATTPNPQTVTLAAGQSIDTVDFGLRQPPATVGTLVFNDINGNGVQDPGEAGQANVTLTLRDPAGNVVATTTTDANGNYQFANIPPGTYTITATPPPGLNALQPNPQTITLAPGQTLNTVNFSLQVAPGSIGNTVFRDLNGNGIQDPGEVGIGGVTVTLRDSSGAVVATAVTDSNGNYLFSNLTPGTYTVALTLPTGATLTTAGSFDVGLAARQSFLSANFGLRGGGVAQLRLVKRITAVLRNNAPLGGIPVDAVITDADAAAVQAAGLRPVGVTSVASPSLQPGDEVEYTIYFVATGNTPALGVSLCDPIPVSTSVVPNTLSTQQGAASAPQSGGTYFTPLAPLPNGNACAVAANPNGSVIFDLGDLDPATNRNVGWVRFRVRLN